MSIQTWVETLVSSQVDGAAYASSNTITSILPAQAVYTLPSNYFYIGKVLRVRALGRISAAVAGPNLTLSFWLGTVATPIVAWTSSAFALVARATTNVTWELDLMMTCRAVGSGTNANLMGVGCMTSEACLGSAASVATSAMLPLTAPAVGTGFDSTITNVANLAATWGTNSGSNSLLLHAYTLESMN
jgi:hypothetical protein